jgi:hypothetical protein
MEIRELPPFEQMIKNFNEARQFIEKFTNDAEEERERELLITQASKSQELIKSTENLDGGVGDHDGLSDHEREQRRNEDLKRKNEDFDEYDQDQEQEQGDEEEDQQLTTTSKRKRIC